MTTTEVSNDQLYTAAWNTAAELIHMLKEDGINPDLPGYNDKEDVDVLTESIEYNARVFMSMDPARLRDEYDALMGAAGLSMADPTDMIGSMKEEIEATWHGDAAVAFTGQLGKIKNCLDQQHEYTRYAAHALGMMYATSVHYRKSFLDLLEKTTQRCEEVSAGLAEPPLNWAKIGIELFKLAKDLIETKGKPTEVAKLAIDKIVEATEAAMEPGKVAGTEAIPVVKEYTTAYDDLFESYEANLRQIANWLSARTADLEAAAATIPEPLPAQYDVDSPDFRYEYLASVSQAESDLGPEVGRERQRYAEEKATGGGLIGQRLSGEEQAE